MTSVPSTPPKLMRRPGASSADGEHPAAPSAMEALQAKFRDLSTRVVSAGRDALAPSSGQWPADGWGDEDGDTAPNTSGEHEEGNGDEGEAASRSGGANFASWLASQEFNASDIVWADDEVDGGDGGGPREAVDIEVDEYVSIADATYGTYAQGQGHHPHPRGAGWALIAGAWRRVGQCWGGEAEGGCAAVSSLSSRVCEESSRVFRSGVSGGRVATSSGEGRGSTTRGTTRRKDGSSNRKKKKKKDSGNNRKNKKKDSSNTVGALCPQRKGPGLSDQAPMRPSPAGEIEQIEEAPPQGSSSQNDGGDAPPAPQSTDLARLFELDQRRAGTRGNPGGAGDHPSVADQSAATAATPLVGEDLLQEEAALQQQQHCDSTCCTYSVSESSSPRGPGPSTWGPGSSPAVARACGGGSPVAAARTVGEGEYPTSRAKVEKTEARRRRRRRMMVERKE